MPIIGRLNVMFDPEVIVPALILPEPTVNALTPIVIFNTHNTALRVVVRRSYPESTVVADRYINANARDVIIDSVPFPREQIISAMSGGEATINITYDIEVYEYNPASGTYDKFVAISTIGVTFRFIDPTNWSGTIVEQVTACRSGGYEALSQTEFGEIPTSNFNVIYAVESSTVLTPPQSCRVYIGTSSYGPNCGVYNISNLTGTRCYLIIHLRRNTKISIFVKDTGRGMPSYVLSALPTSNWYAIGLKLKIPSSKVYICPHEDLSSNATLYWYDEWWVVCK